MRQVQAGLAVIPVSQLGQEDVPLALEEGAALRAGQADVTAVEVYLAVVEAGVVLAARLEGRWGLKDGREGVAEAMAVADAAGPAVVDLSVVGSVRRDGERVF